MSLFLTYLDFENSAEEFHPHETLSTPMKLLSPLSSLIWCHISIINAHETLMYHGKKKNAPQTALPGAPGVL
jgi:hypothetical protein